jgi:hypothetical protein
MDELQQAARTSKTPPCAVLPPSQTRRSAWPAAHGGSPQPEGSLHATQLIQRYPQKPNRRKSLTKIPPPHFQVMAGGHAQPEAIAQPEEAAEAQIVLGGDCAPTLHNRMNAAFGTSDGEGQAASADPHGSQNLLRQHLAGWAIHRQPSRCADWLQQARADLDLPAEAAAGLADAVPDR